MRLEPSNNTTILQMKGIVKAFSGVRALDDVNFDVRPGEVHALIGENGAGKSTLMNVLAGRFDNYNGQITFDGNDVRITNPRQARNWSQEFLEKAKDSPAKGQVDGLPDEYYAKTWLDMYEKQSEDDHVEVMVFLIGNVALQIKFCAGK